jgi:hypothetical protein
MVINLTAFTVTDYCQAMERNEIVVNRTYQRSEKIWPPAARSFLIETMLLGYPMPKLSLYQRTDLKSKKTVKEIVDGQQRSMAIRDFYNDDYRLSSTIETETLRGKSYSELDEDYQRAFIDYQVSVDLFLAATEQNVREVFRRMNSFTVPLNGEEQRHAVFQGKFKWFVHRIGRRFDEAFVNSGVFTEKQLVRMADTKLLAEVCDAMIGGIVTTNKRKLDALYRDRDMSFPEESLFEEQIDEALTTILKWDELHGSALMKPYEMYALILAFIHMRHRIANLQGLYRSPKRPKFSRALVVANLSAMAEALSEPETPSKFDDFVDASAERTNSREQRETRFEWMCRALVEELV